MANRDGTNESPLISYLNALPQNGLAKTGRDGTFILTIEDSLPFEAKRSLVEFDNDLQKELFEEKQEKDIEEEDLGSVTHAVLDMIHSCLAYSTLTVFLQECNKGNTVNKLDVKVSDYTKSRWKFDTNL